MEPEQTPNSAPDAPVALECRVSRIERLRDAMGGIESVLHDLGETIGLDIDGPLHSAISLLIATAALATAESVGVDKDAFEWFVFENHFEREGRVCQWPGKEPVKIDSIEAFLKFEGIEG